MNKASVSKKGRSEQFNVYMRDLKLSDPARWALINEQEDLFVALQEPYLQALEADFADQKEGWSDPTGQRGVRPKDIDFEGT
jgi:hypothetical protein